MAWEACDATEALRMLHDHPRIGLLFTNVVFPGEMDGLALADKVSCARPDIQVVVTSGAIAVSDEELPGSATFLPKPYRADQLVRVVAGRLDGPDD
jgi:two-component system, response regulator PdtaR